MGQQDSHVMKTLTQFILGLAAFAVIIFIIAQIMTGGFYNGDKPAAVMNDDAAIAERIAPVAKVMEAGAAPAVAAAPTEQSGKDVYNSACFACHGTGAAGAPKLGDKAAWSARIAQGLDVLSDHAINGFTGGKGVMPAKGGNPALSDDAVKAAVKYMVDESK